MKLNFSKSLLAGIGIGCLSATTLQAQVIDYKVVYNTADNTYGVYARATANLSNVNLGGSQLGLVFPASVPDVVFTVTQGAGGNWSDGTPVYAPAAQPGSDFHAISTLGNSPISLTANTETLLFSISTGGACVAGVRMYINGVDPTSGDPGMNGGDFTNTLVDVMTLNDYTGVPYDNGGTVCSPLAAQLLGFTGQKNGSDVVLSWSVADERQLMLYRLQRSTDTRTWTNIATVVPKRTGTQASYTYNDAGAAAQPVLYYRLQLEDQQGVVKNSEIVRLKNSDVQAGDFTLVPNPVRGGQEFVLQSSHHSAGVLSVINVSGQQVVKNNYYEGDKIRINTSGWVPGTYLVRWEGENSEHYQGKLEVRY